MEETEIFFIVPFIQRSLDIAMPNELIFDICFNHIRFRFSLILYHKTPYGSKYLKYLSSMVTWIERIWILMKLVLEDCRFGDERQISSGPQWKELFELNSFNYTVVNNFINCVRMYQPKYLGQLLFGAKKLKKIQNFVSMVYET